MSPLPKYTKIIISILKVKQKSINFFDFFKLLSKV